MKLNKPTIIIAILFLVLGSKASLIAAKPVHKVSLTLQEVIEMARQNSPDAMAARHSFQSAYWNFRSFKANYLPSLTVSSRPELKRSINLITLPDGTEKYVPQNMLTVDAAVTIRQNLTLTGGNFFVESALQRLKFYDSKGVSFRSSPIVIGYSQSLFGYNALKWDKKIEPLRYREEQKKYVEKLELVSADAVRKFFYLASAQRNYEMACFNYGNADTLYTLAKGRYDIGTITENELLQLEINRLTESTNQMDAMIEMDESRQELCSLLGLDKEVILEVEIDNSVPDFKVETEEAYYWFSQNNPDFDMIERRLIESESSVKQAKSNAGLKAELYLKCGLSQTGESFSETYHSPLDQQQASIGISLPILDWGRARGKVKVARSHQDLVEVQMKQYNNDLEMNIRKLVMQFNLQSKRVEIARKTDATASRRYDVASRLYLLGKSTVLDLNASISKKDWASRHFLSTLSTYWNLYYMLRSMTLYDFEQHKEIEVVASSASDIAALLQGFE